MGTSGDALRPRFNRKSFLAKQFIVWHWTSSGICLVSMLFFSITGITLNHASSLSGKPSTTEKTWSLPPELYQTIVSNEGENEYEVAVSEIPRSIREWLQRECGVRIRGSRSEWSREEIYVSLPRPGGDSWLSIDRETGTVTYSLTTNGMVAFLNDLHKGRNTGSEWIWFIDLFSVASIVFSLTGLGLLWVHAKRRPSTWPMVLAGVILPILVVVLFVH
ncbi:hypothetical protein VN12_08080 [Pirellula sp. SH-Sr6A]|uniref:PepSY-associated TM helix domain-containing protein n=1 Tax=Pirellula sp. SH-Sr6A TaxID=1632865 RepID=UPI00078C1993|nr:PepSY-associated TM helix domain-containing protein [Pirellula sp. SH-Sr6A]AMV32066.1 hypothetical protein VN12_08080 [Pirellula sp. SH-Sr6A]